MLCSLFYFAVKNSLKIYRPETADNLSAPSLFTANPVNSQPIFKYANVTYNIIAAKHIVARTLRHAIVLEFVPKHCVYPGVFDVKSYRCFWQLNVLCYTVTYPELPTALFRRSNHRNSCNMPILSAFVMSSTQIQAVYGTMMTSASRQSLESPVFPMKTPPRQTKLNISSKQMQNFKFS